jgi:hypothetical protein
MTAQDHTQLLPEPEAWCAAWGPFPRLPASPLQRTESSSVACSVSLERFSCPVHSRKARNRGSYVRAGESRPRGCTSRRASSRTGSATFDRCRGLLISPTRVPSVAITAWRPPGRWTGRSTEPQDATCGSSPSCRHSRARMTRCLRSGAPAASVTVVRAARTRPRPPPAGLECLYGSGQVGSPFLYTRDDPALLLLGRNDRGEENDV